MSLKETVSLYISRSEGYKNFLSRRNEPILADGLDFYPLSLMIHLMLLKSEGRVFAIYPTEERARAAYDEIESITEDVVYLPTNGKLLYSESYDSSSEYLRLQALSRIEGIKRGIVVASIRSFASPVATRDEEKNLNLMIRKGDIFDTSLFSSLLSRSGYYRAPNCFEEGTFALRGEVMDIYPFAASTPYRLYADWDKVEKIAAYDPLSQKSGRVRNEIEIPLIHDEGEIISLETMKARLRESDYFVFSGLERIMTSWESLRKEARARFNEAYKERGEVRLPDELLFPFEAWRSTLNSRFDIYDIREEKHIHYDVGSSRSYFGNVKYFREDISSLIDNGWKIYVASPSEVQKERLENVLDGIKAEVDLYPLSSGFEIPSIGLLAVLDSEIFGRHRQRKAMITEDVKSSSLDAFVELKEGDYVVHVNYGIGRFLKIERLESRGNTRDYIKIQYGADETLYVPIEQANLVGKYIGTDDRIPKLDTIGSLSWSKKKEKARESAERLAKELVRLYAEREALPGHAFSKDNDWQTEFEASFPFTETPDQTKTMEEIKRDMESSKVMDRLICGDVGYGKTELAFRAAFKAILDNKQVVFLAPTVILAEQHYENFIRRIGHFPINVGILTRFVGSKKQREVILGLDRGKVDIVFGTHRLLNKNIKFHDLGLLIVDEEQRFGVKDKEKIKHMKSTVDSLTLSATPIPRTLYMSLLKVRDMSLITTAPRERQEVETHIEAYSLTRIVTAIKRERERGGQVFFLHNRIEDIEEVARTLRAELPGLIIESAHGKMESEELEDKMHRFIYEGVDVLVSTTIIENGIDIPNVNTIIIDRADRLGLAQLYQLRGRVGRSDKKAYCYLLYPKEASLTEDAVRRLKVLSENTVLGSGFKVAMKDMEIRGAGNILGREQSGHLEAVGLDLYMRLLDEEIDRIEGEGKEKAPDVLLELDYTGFIPDSYINDPEAKFDMYKKIASVTSEEGLENLRGEMENRFGAIPDEVDSLLSIAEIKIISKKLWIERLSEHSGKVKIHFKRISSLNPEKVINLIKLSGGKVRLDPEDMTMLTMESGAITLKDKALFILEQLRRIA